MFPDSVGENHPEPPTLLPDKSEVPRKILRSRYKTKGQLRQPEERRQTQMLRTRESPPKVSGDAGEPTNSQPVPAGTREPLPPPPVKGKAGEMSEFEQRHKLQKRRSRQSQGERSK